jgi:hypothetical protein
MNAAHVRGGIARRAMPNTTRARENAILQSDPPPESALRGLTALCGALARGDEASARALLAPGRVDWPALQQVADLHRLTGYLGAQLQARGRQALVAPEFLNHARRIYLQQWVRNGQLFREMERIARALEAAGLPYLFFKGPLLAQRLYDQLGSRAIHDIDLLIPRPGAMPRYEPVLAALGYRRRSRLLLPLSWSRFWLYQLEYESDAFTLEPHWALQRHPSLALDHERIWRERVMLETPGGLAVPALSDEYTLVANLLSIPADLQNASLKLRTYFELFLLWRRFPAAYDWPAFWERRRAERTRRLTRVVLALLQDLFGPAGLAPQGVPPLPEKSRALAAELGAQLFASGTSEWQRKRLAFRLFEAPLPYTLLWWSLSLPARALAHPGVTWNRLRRW